MKKLLVAAQETYFGFTMPDKVQELDYDRFVFFTEALSEELSELLTVRKMANPRESLKEQIDALTDLIIFAEDALYEMGVDSDVATAVVVEKNLEKRIGHNPQKIRGQLSSTLDLVKPYGWTPPDHDRTIKISEILRAVRRKEVEYANFGGNAIATNYLSQFEGDDNV